MRTTIVAFALTLSLTAAAAAAEPVVLDLKMCKLTDAGGEALESTAAGYDEDGSRLFFYAPGVATASVAVAEDGDYVLVVEASCDEALNEKAKMSVKVGDKVVEKEFLLKEVDKKEYEFKVTLKKGETKVALGFTNDSYKENEYDRNLFVYSAKLVKAKAK